MTPTPHPTYRVKRAYDPPSPADGPRILVDRLWPRGVNKEHAELALWAKDATPSNELRKWYHDERGDRYDEFVARYGAELDGAAEQAALREIRDVAAGAPDRTVTLITAAKDIEHSHVPVLVEHLVGPQS